MKKHSNNEEFYLELLEKALIKMGPESGMVVGNIFSDGDSEENINIILNKVAELQSTNETIFNQIPYLDDNIDNAPFDYDLKFETFYKGLIQSGKINKLFVLPSFEKSVGTKKEIMFAEEKLIEIIYL